MQYISTYNVRMYDRFWELFPAEWFIACKPARRFPPAWPFPPTAPAPPLVPPARTLIG